MWRHIGIASASQRRRNQSLASASCLFRNLAVGNVDEHGNLHVHTWSMVLMFCRWWWGSLSFFSFATLHPRNQSSHHRRKEQQQQSLWLCINIPQNSFSLAKRSRIFIHSIWSLTPQWVVYWIYHHSHHRRHRHPTMMAPDHRHHLFNIQILKIMSKMYYRDSRHKIHHTLNYK